MHPRRRSLRALPLDVSVDLLETRRMLSTLSVLAAGVEGTENLELHIDGQVVQSWNNLGTGAYAGDYVTLNYETPATLMADQVRLVFTNDVFDPATGTDSNVRVDAILLDGIRYETESPTVYSTGTWLPADGIVAGYRTSEYLHTNGYLQYASVGGSGSLLDIVARGDAGGETFDVRVGGIPVATFVATTEDARYSVPLADVVAIDQVEIAFTNDLYDPVAGVDRNLHIDYVAIDGTRFETEDPSVYSTGTWLPEDGIVPGYRLSETLHTNGSFRYGQAREPGAIGLTLATLSIDESLGNLTVVIFRSGGTDGEVTVDYTTVAGSADATDFQPISGTLTFADGATDEFLTIPIVDDTDVEAQESFSFVLSNPTGGARLGEITTQVVSIDDNDQAVGGVLYAEDFEGSSDWVVDPLGTDTATTGIWETGIPDATERNGNSLQLWGGQESDGALVTGASGGSSAGSNDIDNGVTSAWSPEVVLPENLASELRFAFNFAHMDNANPDDFFRVAVVAGSQTTTVFETRGAIAIRQGQWQDVAVDLSAYAGQSIRLLVQAADAGGGSVVEAAVDNLVVEAIPEAPGELSIANPSINLDESAGVATVIVTRTSGRSGPVSVAYTTRADSATPGDYTSTSGVLNFADGQTTQSVSIPINNDNLDEDLESFFFDLANPTGGATLGGQTRATITIADDDSSVPDYLPDLTPIASTLTEQLRLDTTQISGRRLMRFSTEVANSGDGPLEIWGGSASGSTQQVFQRVYQADGGSRDRLAGEFVYHAEHGHIHFEGFAVYNLRATTGTQEIVASGGKTSFCLINIRQPLPNVTAVAGRVHGRGGSSCGQFQGISTGYSDVYSSSLPDQWIDITGVPDGEYWLEMIADPDDRIQELDESNNSVRVRISLQNGRPSSVAAAPGHLLGPYVQTEGRTVTVFGSSTSDVFRVDLASRELTVNDVAIPLDRRVSRVVLDGVGGDDVLELRGSSRSERVKTNDVGLDVRTRGLRLETKSIADTRLDMAGGRDRLRAEGSVSADALVVGTTELAFSSRFGTLLGTGFDSVRLRGGGGEDAVTLVGSVQTEGRSWERVLGTQGDIRFRDFQDFAAFATYSDIVWANPSAAQEALSQILAHRDDPAA